MAEVIALRRPKRGNYHHFRMVVGGASSDEAVGDVLRNEIEDYRDCIDGAQASIRKALDEIVTEKRLIAIWEAKIAELEAKRGQLSVVIDFPPLAETDAATNFR